jgi:hypothetical protein
MEREKKSKKNPKKIAQASESVAFFFIFFVFSFFSFFPGTFVRLQPHSAGFSESVTAMRGASGLVYLVNCLRFSLASKQRSFL